MFVVLQEDPLKYCPEAQAAACAHFAGSGMPKSTLEEVPALGSHTFACEEMFAHAALSDSTRAASASVLIHERSPLLFHTCSRWPVIVVFGTVELPQPYAGKAAQV